MISPKTSAGSAHGVSAYHGRKEGDRTEPLCQRLWEMLPVRFEKDVVGDKWRETLPGIFVG